MTQRQLIEKLFLDVLSFGVVYGGIVRDHYSACVPDKFRRYQPNDIDVRCSKENYESACTHLAVNYHVHHCIEGSLSADSKKYKLSAKGTISPSIEIDITCVPPQYCDFDINMLSASAIEPKDVRYIKERMHGTNVFVHIDSRINDRVNLSVSAIIENIENNNMVYMQCESSGEHYPYKAKTLEEEAKCDYEKYFAGEQRYYREQYHKCFTGSGDSNYNKLRYRMIAFVSRGFTCINYRKCPGKLIVTKVSRDPLAHETHIKFKREKNIACNCRDWDESDF